MVAHSTAAATQSLFDLLYDLHAFIARNVHLPDDAAITIAIWIVHTYLLDAWNIVRTGLDNQPSGWANCDDSRDRSPSYSTARTWRMSGENRQHAERQNGQSFGAAR